ncbi:MAG: hypothetical protein IKA36_01720 [Clostridia bacterium]|nr:hypothetical protein [Clostridia bacterium]
MLLSNNDFKIPHTSKCVIHTTGEICNGDIISITSPVFTSTNFKSGAINMSERFNVRIVMNESSTIINDKPDGEFTATLVCDDNDVFNMYVRI